jgi:hypothetical protein
MPHAVVLKTNTMKAVLAILTLFVSCAAFAQLSISTNFRQDGVWDAGKEEWNILSTDDNGTLFEFNRELTMFKHTTATITSDYFISKWDYNEDEVKYTMTVTSDAGNEYEMIIDGINNCVAFFYWYDEQYILVRHTIKQTWFEEDEEK